MQELLREYVRVEKQFQLDSYDKCVTRMRDAGGANMAEVTADIFSNSHVQEKNVVVIELIVSVYSTSCHSFFQRIVVTMVGYIETVLEGGRY